MCTGVKLHVAQVLSDMALLSILVTGMLVENIIDLIFSLLFLHKML